MFRNLQIRSKLGAILVLPLVALVVFASFQVGASVARRAAADRLNRLTGLAVSLTAFVDALQEERATTSAYVASARNRTYLRLMGRDRGDVDRRAAELRSRLRGIDLTDYSAKLQADMGDSIRRMDGLPGFRGSVDGGALPLTQVVNFYGEVLSSSLAVIADMGNQRGAENVEADIAALVEISRAKEASSQSTGVLLTALIRKEFGPGDYQRFATLVGEEVSSSERFRTVASRPQELLFERNVFGADNSALAEVMRQAALAGASQPPSIAPGRWLQVMSNKVNQLHTVEQRVTNDVASAATTARNEAVRQTIVTTIAMLVIVALAIGLSLLLAQSMARPLYVLERAARDVAETHLPGVVEKLQQSDANVDELAVETLSKARGVPVRSRDEIGRVAEAFNSVHQVAIRVAAEQAALRKSIGNMFLNLARRSQRLVDRQLELIDELERDEADAEALENLFRLDHLATRMRRNAEDLIVLSGAEPPRRWSEPVPLPQVVRGAVAEVEDYQRIELLPIDEIGVVGHAVADVIHLLAELLENATSFSPPGTVVRVAGQPAATGYVVEIEDRGLGMSDDELLEANERLANPPLIDFAVSRMLGLFVVGRLSQRYGIRVQLRHSWYGGVTALVLVPSALLTWSAAQESQLEAVRPELAPPLQAAVPPLGQAQQVPPGTGPGGGAVGQPFGTMDPQSPLTSHGPPAPPVAPVGPPLGAEPMGRPEPPGRGADSLGRGAEPLGRGADSLGRGAEPLGRGAPAPQGPPAHGHGPQAPARGGAMPAAAVPPSAARPPSPPRPVPADARPQASAPPPPSATAPAAGAAQGGDHLPIFEQARSDWFDSGAGASYLPLRRHAPQSGPDDEGPPAGPRHQTPLPQRQPQATAPGGHGPRAGGGHGQPYGAQPYAEPPAPPAPPSPPRLTSTGLPRRVPRANLAPGIAAAAQAQAQAQPQARPQAPPPSAAARPSRSPDDVRAMLSSYRSGLERGRRMAAGSETFAQQQGGERLRGLGRNGPGMPDDGDTVGYGGPIPPRSTDDPAQ